MLLQENMILVFRGRRWSDLLHSY